MPPPRRLHELPPAIDHREYLVNSHVEMVLNCGGGEMEGLVAALDGIVKLLAVNLEALPVLAIVIGLALIHI